jgi:hypothetical protein
MIDNILLAATAWGVNIGAVIILAVYVFLFALIIICLIRVSNYFRTAGKEQKLIRMELSKVAEEVHLIRQKLTKEKNQGASTESG